MKERSSFRERAKFSRRILHSSQRILRSPMPNEHPALYIYNTFVYVSMILPESTLAFKLKFSS